MEKGKEDLKKEQEDVQVAKPRAPNTLAWMPSANRTAERLIEILVRNGLGYYRTMIEGRRAGKRGITVLIFKSPQECEDFAMNYVLSTRDRCILRTFGVGCRLFQRAWSQGDPSN